MSQGHTRVPAASTITVILRRNGLMEHEAPPKRGYVRFERAEPNELWAMDFKGDFALTAGGRCYPFGVVDDYSRYYNEPEVAGLERETLQNIAPLSAIEVREQGVDHDVANAVNA